MVQSFYGMFRDFEIILDIKSKSVKAHQFSHKIFGLKSTLLTKITCKIKTNKIYRSIFTSQQK
jgi:hypothetical protein